MRPPRRRQRGSEWAHEQALCQCDTKERRGSTDAGRFVVAGLRNFPSNVFIFAVIGIEVKGLEQEEMSKEKI